MSEQESDILARLRAANPFLVDEDRGRAAVAQLALARILEDPAALADSEPVERAGRRPGHPRRQVWRTPRGVGATVAAVPVLAALVAVTVVVAAGGILLLGHGRQARVEAGSSAASSQQDLLLRTLGVLGTAPTTTDRALAACIERSARLRSCLRAVPPTVQAVEHPALFPVGARASMLAGLRYPRVDLALIRSVSMAGSADHITIFPASWQSSPPSAPRTWGVVVNLVHNNLEELDVVPTSVGALRAHGIALLPALPYPGRPTGLNVNEGAIIVPDGVANVTVGVAIPAGGLPVLENVTAVVHDNVATVPLRTPTVGFGDGSVLRVTWLDAHGKVIRHTTTAFALADWGPAAPR